MVCCTQNVNVWKKVSSARRRIAALLVLWTAVFCCSPNEPPRNPPPPPSADSLAALEVRACLPPDQTGGDGGFVLADSGLFELSRGQGLVSRSNVPLENGCGTALFTELTPAEDYSAAVFFRDQNRITVFYGEQAGVHVSKGEKNAASLTPFLFKPKLLSPDEGSAVQTTHPTFRWEPLRGASSYSLQAAADTAFNQLFFSCEGLAQPEYTHSTPLGPWTVYWRAAARDRNGTIGLWSNVRSFTVVESPPPEPPPGTFTIQGLGVRFDPWDPLTNRAGDFLFLPEYSRVFWEFGLQVGSDQGGTKVLGEFTYLIPRNTPLTAVAHGRIVRAVFQEETKDWEFTAAAADPDIQVGYDHVVEPRVREGDLVAPGDTLGLPGEWWGTLGRFEVSVHDVAAGLFRCPVLYFDPAVADSLIDVIARHMQDWETFKGDSAVYDQPHHSFPGCRVESVAVY